MHVCFTCLFLLSSGTAFCSICQLATAPASALVGRLDLTRTVTVSGNIRSAANAANDRGPVDDGLPLEHMQLLLKRTPEMEQRLDTYIDELHANDSANYHN